MRKRCNRVDFLCRFVRPCCSFVFFWFLFCSFSTPHSCVAAPDFVIVGAFVREKNKIRTTTDQPPIRRRGRAAKKTNAKRSQHAHTHITAIPIAICLCTYRVFLLLLLSLLLDWLTFDFVSLFGRNTIRRISIRRRSRGPASPRTASSPSASWRPST